jgi:hypothetical protein
MLEPVKTEENWRHPPVDDNLRALIERSHPSSARIVHLTLRNYKRCPDGQWIAAIVSFRPNFRSSDSDSDNEG